MKDSLPFMASAVFRPEFGAKQEFSERTMRGMRKLSDGDGESCLLGVFYQTR